MVDRSEIMARAKAGVKERYGGKDLLLMQAVRSLDDLDEAKSLLFTRLKEWFSLNFPELDLSNEETFAKIVEEFGAKEEFDESKLAEIVGEEKAKRLMDAAKKSFGAELSGADREILKEFADQVADLYETRSKIEKYINEAAGSYLKNLSTLTDPILATRLVTVAGGLERLAQMPASTIQVIGAENALFKHLKTGSLPPKHGIIFNSAYIRGAPFEQRGRIARSLAAKLAIAAKADFYTGNFIADKLKADLDKRVKSIQDGPVKHKIDHSPKREEFAPRREGMREPRERYGPRKPSEFRGGKPGFERREGDRPRFEKREGGPREGFRGKPRFGEGKPFRGERREGDRPGFEKREGGSGEGSRGKPRFGGERREGGSGGFSGPRRAGSGKPFRKFGGKNKFRR